MFAAMVVITKRKRLLTRPKPDDRIQWQLNRQLRIQFATFAAETSPSVWVICGLQPALNPFFTMKSRVLLAALMLPFCAFCQWSQVGQNVLGNDESEGYGNQVSISDDGSTIAVAAPYAHENGLFNNGRVEVYRLINNVWTLLGSPIVGTNGDEEMGYALSLNENGNILAVARPYANAGQGAVNVYEYINNAWTLIGAPINGAAQGLGAAIALSNDGLTFASTTGSIGRIYEFDGTTWVQVVASAGNDFMFAVALSGDGTRVIFGGQTWVSYFDKVNGVWGSPTNSILGGVDGVNGGPSFLSMSGDGNFFAKGAELNTTGGSNAGRIVIVDRTDNSNWNFSYITGSTGQSLGRSVSLNHDGSVLAVLGGLPFIYVRNGSEWTLSTILSGQASTSAAISGAGDLLATGYNGFTSPATGEFGVMRAFGNLPNAAPSIDCPENISVNTNAGLCGAIVDLQTIVATDPEDGNIEALQTGGIVSGSLFPAGMSEVSFTATDSDGLTATCSYTVEVADIELPTAQCGTITLQLNAQGTASLLIDQVLVESTDNCGVATETLAQSLFTCDDLGVQNVQVTVTDANGNEGSCLATVTVEDLIAPELECQNATVQLSAEGSAALLAEELVVGFSDNCAANLVDNTFTFTCDDLGTQSVSVSVIDASGNETSCTAEVTVEDVIIPEMACQSIELALDADGEATLAPAQIDLGSFDNCTVELSVSTTDFSCSDLGVNTVTLTGLDASGNTASCTAEVSVIDITAPDVVCLGDTVVFVLTGESYLLDDFTSEIDANDACTETANAMIEQSPAAGTVLEPGEHTVGFTVTDESDNEGSCSFTVTVEVTSTVTEDAAAVWVVYPNPTSGMVFVKSAVREPLFIEVFDQLGREVLRMDVSTNREIDLSALENGGYLVHIFNGNRVQRQRVVIAK